MCLIPPVRFVITPFFSSRLYSYHIARLMSGFSLLIIML